MSVKTLPMDKGTVLGYVTLQPLLGGDEVVEHFLQIKSILAIDEMSNQNKTDVDKIIDGDVSTIVT